MRVLIWIREIVDVWIIIFFLSLRRFVCLLLRKYILKRHQRTVLAFPEFIVEILKLNKYEI